MLPRSFAFPIFLSVFAVLSLSTLLSLDTAYASNQFLFFLVAGVVFWVTSSLPFAFWKHTRFLAYGAVVSLLVLTLVIGITTNGAASWLSIGRYRLQPSEFLKPILMLALAFELQQNLSPSWRGWGRRALLALAPLALVMLQPDLGTSLVLLTGLGCLFLFTRPSARLMAGLLAVSVLILGISWVWFLQPYQKDRLRTFVQPQADPLGSGYNARQAMIAVGSGGFLGQGFGQGNQSHLRFLPERQTDFLFATYAEETGLLGTSFLVGLYASLFFFLLIQAKSEPRLAEQAFILSCITMLAAQTTENIGMNIGLTPITGITLPLFSLGGSSVVATAFTFGLFESLRRSRPPIIHEIT